MEGNDEKLFVGTLIDFLSLPFKMGVKFWPIVQTLNFALVPEKNRVVFVGLASFVWTTYLSFMEISPSKCKKV